MPDKLKSSPTTDSFLKALRRTARYRVQELMGARIKPIKLRISLTNRCNSRCIMCSIWKSTDNKAPSLPGEITVEEIERLCVLNRRFFSHLTHVSLTGGEPTLRRDLVDVVRVLTERLPHCSLSFNSNGFSTPKLLAAVDQCLEFRPKLTVMLSLDGIGEPHTRVRGMSGDIFGSVQRTIDGLIERRQAGRRLTVQVNTVMTNQNSDQLLPVYAFCRERRIEFNPIYITFGQLYQNHDTNVKLDEPARLRLLADMRQINREAPGPQFSETIRLLENKQRDFDCWAGRLIFLVEENCDVFPNGGCPYEFNLGNLRDHDFSFERLLDGPQAKRILSKTKACRLCQIPCEYMTTLRHAEALTGYRKEREAWAAPAEP